MSESKLLPLIGSTDLDNLLDEQLLHPLPNLVPGPVDVSRWTIYGYDANLWATETIHPHNLLELRQRVITVSLKTMKFVNNFLKLNID